MALIGLDGKAYSFDAEPTPAASNSSSSMQPEFRRGGSNVSTRNSFDGMDEEATGDGTNKLAALVHVPPQLFQAPLNPSMPVSFAPSLAQRPSGRAPVDLDFSEFDTEIQHMEEAKRREFQEALEVQAQKIRDETDGTAALPSQIGDSKLFHSMVLKQYGKVHHLGEDPKKAFATRKANKRDARRAKKAEDKADQLEAKAGGAMRKNKHKNRSKGVY